MKKLKLRRWVKVAFLFFVLMLICYILISLITKKTVVITEGKNYTCHGSIIFQVCSGINYEVER